MDRRSRILVALAVASRMALGTTVAEASPPPPPEAATAIESPVAPQAPAPPTKAARRAFDKLQAEMNAAAGAEDWDQFLAKGAEALGKLPEHEKSRGARHDLMMALGTYQIEKRTPEQTWLTIEILNSYLEELRDAYGDAAEALPSHREASLHVATLSGRLHDSRRAEEDESSAPAVPPPRVRADDTAPDRTRPPGKALTVAGATLLGVGGVMLIAGAAWGISAQARYSKLSKEDQRPGNDVTADDERDANRRRILPWTLIVPAVLLIGSGVALVIVGKRKQRQQSTSACLGCLRFAF